jgi:transcriptional regulator of acetoin/glycerol metabolism
MDDLVMFPGGDSPARAWDALRKSMRVPEGFDWMRPEVSQSWTRCLEQHDLTPGVDLPQPKNDEDHEQRSWSLDLQTTLSVHTYNVHSILQDTDATVLLTDTEGTVMHVVGAGASASTPHFLGDPHLFNIGASWHESHVGNNGIGTTAILGKPSAFVAREHFFYKLHDYTTVGYPVRGADGELLAIIGLVCPQVNSAKSLVAFLRMAGALAESDVFKRHHPKGRLIRLRSVDARERLFAQQMAIDGLIVVGVDERVLAINAIGLDLLGVETASQVVGETLEYSLGTSLNTIFQEQSKGQVEVEVTAATGVRLLIEPGLEVDAFDGVAKSTSFKDRIVDSFSMARARAMELRSPKTFIKPLEAADSATDGRDAIVDTLLKKMVALQERKIPVLVIGESGVGKEFIVQLAHKSGPRRNGPLVAINCASIPRDLIESELFGYASGSFTGASKEGRPGKFQLASGGTIFLDEIGDMRFELQSTLLRVLESSEVVPVGGVKPIKVDVQVIAATNASLRDAVAKGTFRRDLYYRLNGAQIWIPSLRERPDKIHLIHSIFEQEKKLAGFSETGKVLGDDVVELFLKHPWPGNIRQLYNVLKAAIFMSRGTEILMEDLPPDFLAETDPTVKIYEDTISPGYASQAIQETPIQEARPRDVPKLGALADWEEQAVLSALQEAAWNVSNAAKRLGITRSTLYQKIAKYGIKKPTRSW